MNKSFVLVSQKGDRFLQRKAKLCHLSQLVNLLSLIINCHVILADSPVDVLSSQWICHFFLMLSTLNMSKVIFELLLANLASLMLWNCRKDCFWPCVSPILFICDPWYLMRQALGAPFDRNPMTGAFSLQSEERNQLNVFELSQDSRTGIVLPFMSELAKCIGVVCFGIFKRSKFEEMRLAIPLPELAWFVRMRVAVQSGRMLRGIASTPTPTLRFRLFRTVFRSALWLLDLFLLPHKEINISKLNLLALMSQKNELDNNNKIWFYWSFITILMRRKSEHSHYEDLPKGLRPRKSTKKRPIINLSNTKYPVVE